MIVLKLDAIGGGDRQQDDGFCFSRYHHTYFVFFRSVLDVSTGHEFYRQAVHYSHQWLRSWSLSLSVSNSQQLSSLGPQPEGWEAPIDGETETNSFALPLVWPPRHLVRPCPARVKQYEKVGDGHSTCQGHRSWRRGTKERTNVYTQHTTMHL